MGWQPSYQSEARIYAKYILKEKPNAKIAVLYQNDDYGKDYLKGLKDGLGAKAASMIVAEESFETTEPTDRQPHRQAQGERRRYLRRYHDAEIRRASDQEDRRDRLEAAALPQQRLGFGRQRHQARRLRECARHHFRGLPEGRFRSAMGQRSRHEGNSSTSSPRISRKATSSMRSVVVGYGVAQTLVQVLKQCGDNLTRENIMKQAANLKDFRTEVLLPGIKINTCADQFRPDQPASADDVQGRALGAVRRRHQRRRRRLIRPGRDAAFYAAQQPTQDPRSRRGGFLLPQGDG